MNIEDIEEEASNRGYWTARDLDEDGNEFIIIMDQKKIATSEILVPIGEWKAYNPLIHKKAKWME